MVVVKPGGVVQNPFYSGQVPFPVPVLGPLLRKFLKALTRYFGGCWFNLLPLVLCVYHYTKGVCLTWYTPHTGSYTKLLYYGLIWG